MSAAAPDRGAWWCGTRGMGYGGMVRPWWVPRGTGPGPGPVLVLLLFYCCFRCFPVFSGVFRCRTLISSVGPWFPVSDPILTHFDPFWPLFRVFGLYRTGRCRFCQSPRLALGVFSQKCQKCHFFMKNGHFRRYQVSRWHFDRFWCFLVFFSEFRVLHVLALSMGIGLGFLTVFLKPAKVSRRGPKSDQKTSKSAKNVKSGHFVKNYED